MRVQTGFGIFFGEANKQNNVEVATMLGVKRTSGTEMAILIGYQGLLVFYLMRC